MMGNIDVLSKLTPEAKEDIHRILEIQNGGGGSGDAGSNVFLVYFFGTGNNVKCFYAGKQITREDFSELYLTRNSIIIPMLDMYYTNLSITGTLAGVDDEYGINVYKFNFYTIGDNNLQCHNIVWKPSGITLTTKTIAFDQEAN